MLSDCQRKLEIGSHRERLGAVRELGAMDSREAYALLEIALEDIDPQIRDEAARLMRESVWHRGGSGPSRASEVAPAIEEGLFG